MKRHLQIYKQENVKVTCMDSIWKSTVEFPEREALEGKIRVDAAVIGGGMAGILTAFLLKESGLETVVLEADQIAGGQTANTTAKITSQHGAKYTTLVSKFGETKARIYGQAHESAIDELEKLVVEKKIACHFRRLPSFLYSLKDRERLEEEARVAASLGLPADFVENGSTGLPFSTVGAVRFRKQAQFHPLEFLKNISTDLTVYEHSRVKKVKRNKLYTDRGIVTADHIIFACHYPIINVPGFYFLRQHQERSYVVAYENVPALPGMYYCLEEGGLSLRSHGDILLAGGIGHRTGENFTGNKYATIRRAAEEIFPDGKEIAHWSAQDCVSHDGLPFLGQYSIFKPGWHLATGFQKWGMTTSMLSAMLIRDEIWGVENPYAALFSPQRFHPAVSARPLLEDLGKSMENLAKGVPLLMKKEEHHRRCSHMGCALNWNGEEETWECPCHGSRFDRNGNLLTEPARKPAKR